MVRDTDGDIEDEVIPSTPIGHWLLRAYVIATWVSAWSLVWIGLSWTDAMLLSELALALRPWLVTLTAFCWASVISFQISLCIMYDGRIPGL